MAIIFQKARRRNWFRIAAFVLAILGFGVTIYYLFFAPSPRIEVIIPEPLEHLGQVSEIEFIDPTFVVESPAFKRLGDVSRRLTPGTLGRQNPFLPL